MFTRISLVTRNDSQALVVPEQAIVPQGDEQYVYRIVDGKAVRVKVAIGQRADGKVEIQKGLTADDVVVTAGQMKLRDGTPVTVIQSNGPVSAAVPAPRTSAEHARAAAA
jgi:membrane fusion protein (multidrug efflux system)